MVFACFLFQPSHTACGILVPTPGIEPKPRHWKLGVLTTGPPGRSQIRDFYVHPQQESGLGREGLTNCGTKPQLKPRGSLPDLYFLMMMKSEERGAKERRAHVFLLFARSNLAADFSPSPGVHNKTQNPGSRKLQRCHPS